MKKVYVLSAFLMGLCLVSSAAFAGNPWFDWFEGYADQAALEVNWPAAGGFISGRLDTAQVLSVTQSMRCEQLPTATRPTRDLEDQAGTLSIWVYDDGEDIKQFDIRINQTDPANYVALGLRDNQAGVQTNYTCNINGTVSDTGIPRSTGWHLFQIQCFGTGVYMKIDGKPWAGNTLGAMTKGNLLTIDTTFGASANRIWVDSAGWSNSTVADRVLSTVSETYILDYGFEKDASNWSGSGTNTIFHATDDGCQSVAGCIDSRNQVDAGAAYAFQGYLPSAVPASGTYKLGFYYMNGPGGWNAVDNLTVAINGQGAVNLGSTDIADWYFSHGETTEVSLSAGANLTITVTGTNQAFDSLTRFDHFYLIYTGADVSEWSQY